MPLPTDYQKYIHLSRYARYIDELGRRETWEETVKRYCDFFQDKFPEHFPYEEIYNAIVNLEVMPSMRALMTAGKALDRDNVAGFNCSYASIEDLRSFDELMYILLCGTGNGFSVERVYVHDLPEVPSELLETDSTIVVPDSKMGWSVSFRELLHLLYAGRIPKWDLSKIRPAGARLKTFGGRASGPEPLDELFRFSVALFKNAKGRKLNTIEVHDLACKVADVVVVGGVRRSALISLSNLTDERMQRAKMGEWWEMYGHRKLANNSVAYTEKPDISSFMKEWQALYESKSGERGIFNRTAAANKAKSTGRRDWKQDFGTNPCGEIILRNHGFCNLSEVVVRHSDEFEDLKRKVRIATIIGTFQSTLTNFRYLRPIWKKNAEEERLLGVSLTGILDNPLLFYNNSKLEDQLTELKHHAIQTNQEFAERIGISPSVAITTVKPSGTVSQLVNSSSGIHPRWSRFYLRTVRADKKDPLAVFMRSRGFYAESDVTKPEHTDVFYFPEKAPSTSVLRSQITAIEQLEHYLILAKHWCEHNPSITVYLRDEEWMEAGAWVYKHFDEIGGISFLPHSDHIYKQAPYQEITEEEYNEWVAKMPQVDWSELREETDTTTSSQEFACSANSCEI
jgi:ribonucleoside-triphosphate reductase (thioredoxin)